MAEKKMKPQKVGRAYLYKDDLIFSYSATIMPYDSPCLSFEYFPIKATASDLELGETVKAMFDKCYVFEGRENKPKPDTGMGHIEIYSGAGSWSVFTKIALLVNFKDLGDRIEFCPSIRYTRQWTSHEPRIQIFIPSDSSVEEIGATLRKTLALCDPKKNEYVAALYPNGDYPPEVLKMHGGKIREVKSKVDTRVAGPHPFGPRMTWVAVRAEDPLEFLPAMGVFKYRAAQWEVSIDRIMKSFSGNPAFVTPPVQGWSFLLWPMFMERGVHRCQKYLAKLSKQFGEAQAFGTDRVSGYALWAKARDGVIERWFHELEGEVVSVGEVTKEEKKLLKYGKKPVEEWMVSEEDVFRMAGAWSLNPMDFAPGDPVAVGPGWVGTAMKG